ncbi:Uncharacterised protein [Burkholderia pseudomallei]|nr:Uncharacterised protein [Burkholderia pseudomallei]
MLGNLVIYAPSLRVMDSAPSIADHPVEIPISRATSASSCADRYGRSSNSSCIFNSHDSDAGTVDSRHTQPLPPQSATPATTKLAATVGSATCPSPASRIAAVRSTLPLRVSGSRSTTAIDTGTICQCAASPGCSKAGRRRSPNSTPDLPPSTSRVPGGSSERVVCDLVCSATTDLPLDTDGTADSCWPDNPPAGAARVSSDSHIVAASPRFHTCAAAMQSAGRGDRDTGTPSAIGSPTRRACRSAAP